MANTKLTLARLNKEQQSLLRQPMDNALVARQGNLNFYFCIYNLDGDYKNGFYYGLLQLHPNYPFAAPKLFFYTPNGRYEINMAICTSFTSYHQQSWTSAWNVRTLIQGTISFMLSQDGSYGCRNDSSAIRKQYAQESLTYNYKIQKFVQLFDEQIKKNLVRFTKIGIIIYDPNLKKLIASPSFAKQLQLDKLNVNEQEKKQKQKKDKKEMLILKQNQKQQQRQKQLEQMVNILQQQIRYRQRQPYNYNAQIQKELLQNQGKKLRLYQPLNQPLLNDQLPLQQDDQNQRHIKNRNKKIKAAVIIGTTLLIVGVSAYFGYKYVK